MWKKTHICTNLAPHLGYCSVTHLSRHDAVTLRRLRIGHTRVTHKYLFSGDSQPLCDECKCSLTVKHILLECCSLKDVREKYFACSSLKELFENVDATTIMDFIKEVQFSSLLADRTNGRAIATLLRLSSSSVVFVCRLSVTLCIVAKRCVLEQKLLWRAYRKSYMRNRLVPKWMTLTFV